LILHIILIYSAVGMFVLDAAGIGRAFPKLQMCAPYIYGLANYSVCAADHKERVVSICHAPSAEKLEAAIRDICIEMG